jgi:hypothetical protein
MAMADEIVFDMSSQSEGTPSVFTKKDWLSILDNQNQNYQGNQSVIDTSQLANSNKFLNYREAYLTVPLILTVTSNPTLAGQTLDTQIAAPGASARSLDFAVGLKNWYGSIVHSFTVDYNGTTIIQQTPYIGLWNTFKLMTSLSVDDLITQGSSIGFYPDTALSAGVEIGANGTRATGYSTFNNSNGFNYNVNQLTSAFNIGSNQNTGLLTRQKYTNIDPEGTAGGGGSALGALQSGYAASPAVSGCSSWNLLWKGYIFNKQSGINVFGGAGGALSAAGTSVWQVGITSAIYLKHLHSFFERVPLLKGVFMKLTLNLNQSSVSFTTTSAVAALPQATTFTACSVQSPLGGTSPIMLASGVFSGNQANGGACWGNQSAIVSLFVGNRCLNSTQISSSVTNLPQNSPMSGSILLNVPAYSFNPVFESSYLSSPVKKIIYTDVYQYQVLGVAAGAVYNNLITNGIANIKSVLVLPFYSAGTAFSAGGAITGNGGLIPFQSPFDPAGGGPTSPQCLMTQFNIQISGQNAIYNTERYEYEQFLNQFKGVNSINGGQEDGLSSGLVGQSEFDSEYCYYYVNCGRMLPVEEAVPKSVNILGTNTSAKNIDMYIFVEYGVEVNVDILTGARV